MFKPLEATRVVAAAQRIAPHIRRTRLVQSEGLSRIAGGDVYLKLENEQTTGSFKLRGALNRLAMLSDEQKRAGIVASSAGNHGLGVAYAAKTLGLKAKVYVPRSAPEVKKNGIRQLGAELDDSERDYDAAMDAAKAFGKKNGREFINPCLGDELLAGQGTVAIEILDDLPDLGSLVLSVGGGGLLGGCASYVRASHPSVLIFGAQSVNTAAMSRSLSAGKIVEIESVPTLADGLAGQIDQDAFEIGRHGLDGIVTLTEEEIAETIRWLAGNHGVTAEGAGACAAGAVLHKKLKVKTPCAVVVSGGNIDDAKFNAIVDL